MTKKREEDLISRFVGIFLYIFCFLFILVAYLYSSRKETCSLFDVNQTPLKAKITDRYINRYRGVEIEFYYQNELIIDRKVFEKTGIETYNEVTANDSIDIIYYPKCNNVIYSDLENEPNYIPHCVSLVFLGLIAWFIHGLIFKGWKLS